MKLIDWTELTTSEELCTFIDVTSLQILFDDKYNDVSNPDLFQAAKFRASFSAKGILDDSVIRRLVLQSNAEMIQSNIPLLKILEAIIVSDKLVFDKATLEGCRGNFDGVRRNVQVPTTNPWLYACSTPTVVYESVYETILSANRDLREKGWEQMANLILPTESAEYWWSMGQKLYHDELATRQDIVRFTFADTNDSFRRLLYYLELARAARRPVILSPRKEARLKELSAQYVKIANVHANIVNMTAALRQELRDGLYSERELPIPALSEYIILTALDNKVSLLEAALLVRASREAVAYRAWLRERQKEVNIGWALSSSYKSEIAKLQTIVDDWSRTRDPREGVRFRTRSLNIEGVPYIGWLAKLVNLKTPVFRDKVLDAPGYIHFVSKWHDYE